MKHLPRLLAVVFLSAGAVAYEILLVRIFAIEHFYHFAYMAIGVAMLGVGTSGTLLALAGNIRRTTAEAGFAWSALGAAAFLIASPALVHQVSLDATQLAWDTRQWPRLAIVYLLLAAPFAVGALATVLALTIERDRAGRIYGASFVGAGVGAALAVGILWVVVPVRALALPAVLASFGGVAASSSRARHFQAMAWLTVVGALVVLARPLWRLDVTPYKGLPQVEAYPNAVRVAEHTSPLGWIVAVDAPAFRHAPGLSLAYRGDFPKQTALFVDGQITGAVADWRGDDRSQTLVDWLPSAAPYALGERPWKVLVLGAGGGTEIQNALVHGATHVTAVELQPAVIRLAQQLARQPSSTDVGADVRWVAADIRNYIAQHEETFDLITIGPGGGFGTASAGVHSLNEDFLHTVDAYAGYLERLNERGVLAITRWLSTPLRESIRVILTGGEALRRTAPEAVSNGLVVARSWGTTTVMIKPSGFTEGEIEALKVWAVARRFDLDWHPGIGQPVAGFNALDEPTTFHAAAAAVSGRDQSATFADAYPFDIAPVDDARPYPHHFLRLKSLPVFLRTGRGNWLPFAEWGYIALAATLFQSTVLAGLLMLVPLVVQSKARPGQGVVSLVAYFLIIGLAYMAAEIAAIQQLSLLLGHPVYAVAAVLATLLICSGAGSAWSDWLAIPAGRRACIALAVMLALYGIGLMDIVHGFQSSPLIVRAVVGVTCLAPPAIMMGLPFPFGLRALAGERTVRVAWAWGVNGFASVVATPLAALIALEGGSPMLFLIAAASYAGAATLLPGKQPLLAVARP